MTNEEAIKILKPLFEHCKGKNGCLGYIEHFFTKDEEEALDMAIKALEQQPCETIKEIPKDYKYDTETEDFLVYRHMYTGQEIHIEKPASRCRLEQQPCENKIIDEHYKKGFANGIRTAEWRYNHAIKEIREHADRLKDSLYGDGLRYALEIIDKYKVESEDKE